MNLKIFIPPPNSKFISNIFFYSFILIFLTFFILMIVLEDIAWVGPTCILFFIFYTVLFFVFQKKIKPVKFLFLTEDSLTINSISDKHQDKTPINEITNAHFIYWGYKGQFNLLARSFGSGYGNTLKFTALDKTSEIELILEEHQILRLKELLKIWKEKGVSIKTKNFPI